MANSAEQLGKGCVALLNLVISSIILGVLVVLLLPDFINVPEWTKNLRNHKLIEKRKVKGTVKLVPNPQNPSENQVILFNVLSGGIPVKKIFKKEDTPTAVPLLLTSQKANVYERLWDKTLPFVDAQQHNKVLTRYDFNTMYLLHKKKLNAWYLKDGQEKWQIELNSPIEESCKECFQLSLDFGLLLVLTQSQDLYAINLSNGSTAWQLKLPQNIDALRGFYVYKNFVCLLQSPQEKPTYLLININQGKIQKEIVLGVPTLNKAYKQVRNQLFYFLENENEKVTQLAIQDIEGREANQRIALPANSRVFAASRELYDQLPEWWREDSRYIFLKLSLSRQSARLLRIRRSNGEIAFLKLKSGFEWVIVDESQEYLLLNAIASSQNQRNELWVISKANGQLRWSYPLKNPQVFQSNSQNLTWAAHIDGQSLTVLEWNEKKNLDVGVFQLANGILLRKNSFQFNPLAWEGVTWERGEAWLSAQDLFRLDLQQLRLTREFP